MFEKRGLKVIAAPWNYAFCGKMNLFGKDAVEVLTSGDYLSFLSPLIRRGRRRPLRSGVSLPIFTRGPRRV